MSSGSGVRSSTVEIVRARACPSSVTGMGWLDRLRSISSGAWDGTTGTPRSANGASSFHLTWEVPARRRWIEARALLEVVAAPEVPALVFWALQASFERAGRDGGAGHLGLQWYPA